MLFTLLYCVALACSANGLAIRGYLSADAERRIDPSQLASVLNCTNTGGLNAVKNPYLLVPGTASTGAGAYGTGYVKLLTIRGYDVCHITAPPTMLDDIQNSAEYISYAMESIYNVTRKPFPVQGHSQGNLVIQFSLTFYPSLRSKISQFISLAGDFRGTPLVKVITGLQKGNSPAAITQQAPDSELIQAFIRKGGNYQWVPTTSVFSRTDETVLPQLANSLNGSTSYIGGSRTGNILVQEICPFLAVGHNEHLYKNFSYQVVLQALNSTQGFVSQDSVRNSGIDCSGADATGLSNSDVKAITDNVALGTNRVLNPVATYQGEPPLRDYVSRFPDNSVHD